MLPTAKWNEELSLHPKRPMPPPRRYEIMIDGRKTVLSIRQTAAPSQRTPQEITMRTKRFVEIQGASLREDELMEHASNDRERGLIVDAAGQIHRPDEIAPRGTAMLGQPFFPPTYVGEQVTRLPGGNVISRRRLRALVASGRLKMEPNMVNSLRSGRIRRRRHHFDPKLAMQAAALSNPGAYHGLAISPRAALRGRRPRRSAAILGYALAAGRAKIGRDGSVYIRARDESGASVFKKVGRIVKKGTKIARKGVRTVGRGAVATGKGVAKGAKFVAKGAARLAAMPLILMVRPAIRAKSRQLAGGKGRPVTKVHTLAAKKYVIAQLGKRGAPGKMLAGILSFVSGEGSHQVGGFVMGFDPGTITAFISANAVWIVPMVAAMVAAINKMTPSTVTPSPSPPVPGLSPPEQMVAPEYAPGAVPEDVEVPGADDTDQGPMPGELVPEETAVEGWGFLTFSERLPR